jgi:hypothetical protein
VETSVAVQRWLAFTTQAKYSDGKLYYFDHLISLPSPLPDITNGEQYTSRFFANVVTLDLQIRFWSGTGRKCYRPHSATLDAFIAAARARED